MKRVLICFLESDPLPRQRYAQDQLEVARLQRSREMDEEFGESGSDSGAPGSSQIIPWLQSSEDGQYISTSVSLGFAFHMVERFIVCSLKNVFFLFQRQKEQQCREL